MAGRFEGAQTVISIGGEARWVVSNSSNSRVKNNMIISDEIDVLNLKQIHPRYIYIYIYNKHTALL